MYETVKNRQTPKILSHRAKQSGQVINSIKNIQALQLKSKLRLT